MAIHWLAGRRRGRAGTSQDGWVWVGAWLAGTQWLTSARWGLDPGAALDVKARRETAP